MSCQIILIAAFGNQGQVGLNNSLPWNIPKELQHFKNTTEGYPIVMGRKTFESIGHPLPNRKNIIVSNTLQFLPGAEVVPSIKDAIRILSENNERIFVIGGARVWQEGLPLAHNLVLSEVNYNGEADISLPVEFFADIRSHFRMNSLRHDEQFTVSYWSRMRAASK